MPLAKTVPELTRPEKAAGRRFRQDQTEWLLAQVETNPPTYIIPPFVANYRHLCGKTNNSKAIVLQERYVHSPAYTVLEMPPTEEGGRTTFLVYTSDEADGERAEDAIAVHEIPAGRFGFWYKVGKCNACKQTASSKVGKWVDANERPPLQGRVARQGRS